MKIKWSREKYFKKLGSSVIICILLLEHVILNDLVCINLEKGTCLY